MNKYGFEQRLLKWIDDILSYNVRHLLIKYSESALDSWIYEEKCLTLCLLNRLFLVL